MIIIFILNIKEKCFCSVLPWHVFGLFHSKTLDNILLVCNHLFLISHCLFNNVSRLQFSSLQSLSRVWLFVTPWTAAHQASLSITNFHSLLKFMSIKSVMPSNTLILCCPLLLLPSSFPTWGSFPRSQFFTSDDQSIGASASASVLPIKWTCIHWNTMKLTFNRGINYSRLANSVFTSFTCFNIVRKILPLLNNFCFWKITAPLSLSFLLF